MPVSFQDPIALSVIAQEKFENSYVVYLHVVTIQRIATARHRRNQQEYKKMEGCHCDKRRGALRPVCRAGSLFYSGKWKKEVV